MDIIMPQLGETVLEGTVMLWHKEPGQSVRADEPLFEIETDKVTTEIPSPVSGVLREILVPVGASAKIGERLAIVEEAGSAPTAFAPAPTPTPASAEASSTRGSRPVPRVPGARLSPVVRRLLGEAGLTHSQVSGTGRDGRVTREDVLARLPTAGGQPGAATATAADRVVPLNRLRRATAAHMRLSVATSPHTLQAVEVDFHAVERARTAHGEAFRAQHRVALTYLPFVCRAVCDAIADFPYINSSFADDQLTVYGRVHLGIAIDLSHEGLVAPVLRDSHQRSVRALAMELASLAARARANELKPDDLRGGTYTITNSGSFGTLITAPLINQPQVAILSTDGVRKKPVVIEGPEGDCIAIRPIGILAQSFDHRAFDGAYSAAFLRRVRQSLEGRDWVGDIDRIEYAHKSSDL